MRRHRRIEKSFTRAALEGVLEDAKFISASGGEQRGAQGTLAGHGRGFAATFTRTDAGTGMTRYAI